MRELFSEFEHVPLKIYAAMDYDTTTTKDEIILKECFVMPIYSECREGHVHRIDILLLAATTLAWGFYQRIGFCRIFGGIIHHAGR